MPFWRARGDTGDTRTVMQRSVKFEPVVARTLSLAGSTEPAAFDYVKFVFVRDGSTRLTFEGDEALVTRGDAALIGSKQYCSSHAVESVTFTALYVDLDFLIDQLFWQNAQLLSDRIDAFNLAQDLYREPTQILRLGTRRIAGLTPWLDELVSLSLAGHSQSRFHRLLALLHAVVDVVSPFIQTSTAFEEAPRSLSRGRAAQRHGVSPIRREAWHIASLMDADPSRDWTLADLAREVHLSASQVSRVFSASFGQSPLTYLTDIRAKALARYLRETDLTIGQAMQAVGWRSRSHAAELFRKVVGVSPSQYRRLLPDSHLI